MQRISSLRDIFDFFSVYKCISCGKILDSASALCPECRERYIRETKSSCPVCSCPQTECSCLAHGKKNSFRRVMHVSAYKKGNVTGCIVRGCKRVLDGKLLDFVADEVSRTIERRLCPTADTLIVPIPRSRGAVREYGFDQAEEVARRTARKLGINYFPAVLNRGKRPQKELGYRERLKNASEEFYLSPKVLTEGKHFIIYDDVCTSGASAEACRRLLDGAGAAAVDFASFARTEK